MSMSPQLGCRGRLWMINHFQSPRLMHVAGIGSWTQADAVWSFREWLVCCAFRHIIPSTSRFIYYRLMEFASCCLSYQAFTWLRFFVVLLHDWLVWALIAEWCPPLKAICHSWGVTRRKKKPQKNHILSNLQIAVWRNGD